MLWQQRPGYWNDGGLREGDLAAFICEWGPKGPFPAYTDDVTEEPVVTDAPEREEISFEDGIFTMRVYLPKVLNDFGAIEVSGIGELYEELEPYYYPFTGSLKEEISLREKLADRFRWIADTYIHGEIMQKVN